MEIKPLPAHLLRALSTPATVERQRSEMNGEECDEHPELRTAGERILAGMDFTGAEPTGDRAWIAVNKLLDLRSSDGKIMSPAFVLDLLPWVSPSVIENAIKHGQNVRGDRTCEHLLPPEPGIPAEWLAAAEAQRYKRPHWREQANRPPLEYFDKHQTMPRVPGGGAVCNIIGHKEQHKTGVGIKLALDAIEQGFRVLYIAAEGAHGIATARFPAAVGLRSLDEDVVQEGWWLYDEPFTLWTDAAALIAKCEEAVFRPDIIAFDTMTRIAPGDVNSPEYGTNFHLHAERLGRHFGAMIWNFAHPAEDGKKTLGSRLIDALAYSVLHISHSKGIVSSWVDRMKDGKAQFAVTYGVHRVDGVPVIVDAPQTPAGAKEIMPSSLRTMVLQMLEGSTERRTLIGMLPHLIDAGFSEATVKKACKSGDLNDLMVKHGDGSLKEPASFSPLHQSGDN